MRLRFASTRAMLYRSRNSLNFLTRNIMARRRPRDLERTYSPRQFAAKLRRLANAVERGRPFTIQVAGESLRIPGDAEATLALS